MEISINADRELGCTVRLGSCAVPFRCEATAGQFVERLRQRLAAARAVQMPPVTDAAPPADEHVG
ncbi:MAG: hypothetical protein AAAB13_12400 [Pseudomonas sp.]